jgi:heavy metal sensor kinase
MRLTLWYAIALGVALLTYALFIYFVLWKMLAMNLNRQLEQDVKLTERMLVMEKGQLVWKETHVDSGEEIPGVNVESPDGTRLYRSPRYKKIQKTDHQKLKLNGYIEGIGPVSIQVFRRLEPMREELEFIAIVLISGIPLAILLSAVGGSMLARRALVSVDRMASQVQIITAERLSERLPIENPDDELGRLAGVFNAMFERLEYSFEELRRFTADASHELRTPLTALRSVGEVGLAEPRNEEEYREIIGSMLEEADRLTRLVESLLTLSRSDWNRLQLRREDTNLNALTEQVVHQLAILAEEKKQTVLLDMPPETVFVSMDSLIFRQSITNLLDNAIKYSPPSSSIRIAVVSQENRVLIEVSDQGPGIPPEQIHKIFDRFYRVDKARSREMRGVGLGLAIARWAVESHGGSITVESEVGKGCLFRISLPKRVDRQGIS